MKTHRTLTPRQEAQAERNLAAAFLNLRSVDEVRAFLRDLCTPAELQAMADRWAVVDWLKQGLPYREIHKLSGVSVTTIGRVARYWRRATADMQRPRAAERAHGMDKDQQRLKLAVQKSGRLTDPSVDLLVRCGLKLSRGKDQLVGFGENMPLDVLFVRDDDIPDLVQEDVCDLGLVGLNVLEERRLEFAARGAAMDFELLRTLDFGRCRMSLAVPEGYTYDGVKSLAGKRIATTYPFILGKFLADNGVDAQIVTLSGAVEIAPRLGRADLICDLVSTGSTLQANHMREVQTVLESHAVLIRTPVTLPKLKQDWVERLLLRIDGVEQVKESKYIMLHAPRSALAEIRRLLPGSESPTIIPLEGFPDKVAVHAVCRENVFWETLESLKGAGASALLVLPVEKMLA